MGPGLRLTTKDSEKFFRARIGDGPQVAAVLDLLHLRREPAIAADPRLQRLRIVRHQVRCPFIAHHLDAEGERLVDIRLMQADAGARRYANLVQRHDAEHQRAGRIADAVDDDALAAFGDALVLRLVLFDIAAVIARDAQIRLRGRVERQRREDNESVSEAHDVKPKKTKRTFENVVQKHHNSGGTVLANG